MTERGQVSVFLGSTLLMCKCSPLPTPLTLLTPTPPCMCLHSHPCREYQKESGCDLHSLGFFLLHFFHPRQELPSDYEV